MYERMTTSNPDVQALIEHSTKLNTIAWRMAVALGEVPEGATKITADAEELLDRLLDRLSALSGETEAEWGVAYRTGDGSLFVDECVNEDDARFRAENSDAYDLLVSRKVKNWEVVV